MFGTGNLRRLLDKIDLTQARVEKRVTKVYRDTLEKIFIDIVTHTPQFTGNLVESWQIVTVNSSPTAVGISDSERKSMYRGYITGSFDPYSRGDDPAVSTVLARELPKLENIRHNSIVRFVNTAEYADEVDQGLGPLRSDGTRSEIRPENLYYGKVFMLTYADHKYSKLANMRKLLK